MIKFVFGGVLLVGLITAATLYVTKDKKYCIEKVGDCLGDVCQIICVKAQ